MVGGFGRDFEGYLRAIRCDKVVDRVVLYGAYLFLVSCIE